MTLSLSILWKLLFVSVCVAGVCAQIVAQAPERKASISAAVTVTSIGVRLRDQPVSIRNETLTLPKVLAVAQGSSGYLAGIQPGDFIRMTGGGSTEPLSALKLAEFFEQRASGISSLIQVPIIYPIADNGGWEGSSVHVFSGQLQNGDWITTPLTHYFLRRSQMPGVRESLDEYLDQSRKINADLRIAISKNPCGITQEEMQPELNKMDRLLLVTGRKTGSHPDLKFLQEDACNNLRKGEISSFELAVRFIVSKNAELKACDYRADKDYSSIFIGKDISYKSFTLSKENYDRDMDEAVSSYIRSAPSEQKDCFIRLIRASFAGMK